MTRGTKPTPAKTRFWAFASLPDENGCMHWRGYVRPDGYGGFNQGWRYGGMTTAHRFAYELANGAVPDGLHIDHLCRVRDCVAPDHLEAVTQAENTRRGEAGYRRPEVCKNGHEFTPENVYTTKDGFRHCRECGRRRSREYQARLRARRNS